MEWSGIDSRVGDSGRKLPVAVRFLDGVDLLAVLGAHARATSSPKGTVPVGSSHTRCLT